MPTASAPRVLAFAGSARQASLNRKLLAIAVEETRAAGAEVTLLDLNDFTLPLYHGDLEEESGMPEAAQRLVKLMGEHDALLVASPEYNSQLTPLLKNTIDWCSRADANPFTGKIAAVISASPGPYGGLRSAAMSHQLLDKLGAFVIPATCHLIKAGEAFDEAGKLNSERRLESVRAVATQLVRTIRQLKA